MKIALITTHPWVGISTPVIETAKFLASKGDEVLLFIQLDSNLQTIGLGHPDLDSTRIQIIPVVFPSLFTMIQNRFPVFLKEIISSLFFWYKFRSVWKSVSFLIGYDPFGIIRTGVIARFTKISYIYHSLELYNVSSLVFNLAVCFVKKAKFTLIQDRNRARILSVLSKIVMKEILILRNSTSGFAIRSKENYFRKKFKIDRSKKIALVTGTLLPLTGIEVILKTTSEWPNDWVLVLHGWVPDSQFLTHIKNEISENPGRIFLSTDLIPSEQKFSIFQSVDLCFIWYSPDDLNLKYAAGSAGKYYDSLRCGLPMIGNQIPMMGRLLEGVGIVVRNEKEIAAAIKKISADYDTFQENGFRKFENFEFSRSFEPIYEKINEIVGLRM